MSLAGNLLFFWRNRKTVREVSAAIDRTATVYKEEEKKMEKPGWKSTEFWMTLMTNVVSVVGAMQGVIDPQTAAIILAVANGIYGVLRTLAKKP